MNSSPPQSNPRLSRRSVIQAGAIGLMGLGIDRVEQLRASDAEPVQKSKACIFIFLSGGMSQLDSFDLKPHAPSEIRGEFRPIATRTAGLQICEHLPMLAERSENWSLVRSLTHPFNEHFEGHMAMLTGRTEMPPGFRPGQPAETDWPSIAAISGEAVASSEQMPPAVVLPEVLKNPAGRVASGQFAGAMGARRDPWLLEASPFRGRDSSGAFPSYSFNHLKEAFVNTDELEFKAPHLSLPEGLHRKRLANRLSLLSRLDQQRSAMEQFGSVKSLNRFRQAAISLLTDPKVRNAFDVSKASDKTRERYGQNSFGWSLLMARRLVEAGVKLVQVNLGNWNSWDTHGANFPKLKDFLFPPTDRALSALLDDLRESEMLDDTLVVMVGEFGRTPKISLLPKHYKLPGRDHWGAAQTALFAGGGVRGGQVIGATDKIGAYPVDDPQKPENIAASIYHAIGIPAGADWRDEFNRPHRIYHGSPISQFT